MTGRKVDTLKSTIARIHDEIPNVNLIPLSVQLGSTSSIRAAAERILNDDSRLDILLLNAGVAFAAAGSTESGYEVHFGTNHVGHALLTMLLMPKLLETAATGADVRICAVSSHGHTLTPEGGIAFEAAGTEMAEWYPMTRYGMSKLANVLFAKELHKRYGPSVNGSDGICVTSIHPGAVNTEVFREGRYWLAGFWGRWMGDWAGRAVASVVQVVVKTVAGLFFYTPEAGALNQVWCCTAPRATSQEKNGVNSGEYYDPPCGIPGDQSENSKNDELAEKLWDWTENEIKPFNNGKGFPAPTRRDTK